MQYIAKFIAAIHDAWLKLSPGVRVALSFSAAVLAAAAIGLVQAFGWFIPGSIAGAKAEVIAFLTYALPVLAVLATQLVRSKIAPALVAWFLSTFGYATAARAQVPATRDGLSRPDIWVRL
jgi:hypothetical protein